MKNYLFFLFLFSCSVIYAQNTIISGLVKDSNNQSVPGANIKVIGDNSGTVSDVDGKFTLTTTKTLPFVIEITSVGYGSKTVSITSNNQKISVKLLDQHTSLDEVVVSASRVSERILESPVTIERVGIREIKRTASPTFYDGLENLKEVQMNTSSLTFKSINTRGFATISNVRFMQLVDGMDNASPLLNFVLGNMIGVSDIDVQSVELLPGASSALYGANAFNGIMFMNSKSPFRYEGVSTYLKYGATSQEAAGTNQFYDFGVRMARAFNRYFAAKVNMTFMQGTDWYAVNYDDKNRQGQGITRSDTNYDGINVYGDEVSQDIYNVGQSMVAAGYLPAGLASLLPKENVSRTGYNEIDLTDYKAANTKIDFSLHLRPFGDERVEVIWQSKYGSGNAVYQGSNRYYLNGFSMAQHKIEVRGDNFFVRSYTTTEDGGDSYDMQFTGLNVNRAWKSDSDWFGQYAGTYAQAYAGLVPGVPAGDADAATSAARSAAETGRLIPGTEAFKNAFNKVIEDPDVLTGSKLVDNSRVYHSDANYNFKDYIKFGEVQVGGSYREYLLNSHGRIYTDADGPIAYNEYGVYTQLQKKLLEDRLKFTGSVRYDKSENFDGNYSPRISLVYSAGKERQHNIRGSFQTGFRNPTTQDQYIGFNVGHAVLVGAAPDNLLRYSETRSVSSGGQAFTGGSTVIMTGENAYYNSYTVTSLNQFLATGDASLLRRTNIELVKPEEVKAFELGYRSQIKGVDIDLNGYYNIYNDFIGATNAVATYYGTAQDAPDPTINPSDPGFQTLYALSQGDFRAYQLFTNTPLEIHSLGVGVGVSKRVFQNYNFGISYNFAEFDFDQESDSDFRAGFNTPKHRVKASVGNDKLFENFGFNASVRWNSEYFWEAAMVDGIIDEATVVDLQINYGLPKLKSIFKIGATNLAGKEYTQVLGAGAIGQQYFASWVINP